MSEKYEKIPEHIRKQVLEMIDSYSGAFDCCQCEIPDKGDCNTTSTNGTWHDMIWLKLEEFLQTNGQQDYHMDLAILLIERFENENDSAFQNICLVHPDYRFSVLQLAMMTNGGNALIVYLKLGGRLLSDQFMKEVTTDLDYKEQISELLFLAVSLPPSFGEDRGDEKPAIHYIGKHDEPHFGTLDDYITEDLWLAAVYFNPRSIDCIPEGGRTRKIWETWLESADWHHDCRVEYFEKIQHLGEEFILKFLSGAAQSDCSEDILQDIPKEMLSLKMCLVAMKEKSSSWSSVPTEFHEELLKDMLSGMNAGDLNHFCYDDMFTHLSSNKDLVRRLLLPLRSGECVV